jgi:RNA polymerase sigma-70 factor (ECF subfamily)
VAVLASPEDLALVERLRGGDEVAFATLVDRLSPGMLRVALARVPTRAAAEEAVQDAWVGVLDGLDRFEGRSSLKTWIYRILINRAITGGQRERRTVPFSSLSDEGEDGGEPSVDPSRFRGPGDAHPGHWAVPPTPWDEIPEHRLLAAETLSMVAHAIRALPPGQRDVVTLRDVEGWTSAEVCNALGISETNQRVLLHRGRSKVRLALELHLSSADVDGAGRRDAESAT